MILFQPVNKAIWISSEGFGGFDSCKSHDVKQNFRSVPKHMQCDSRQWKLHDDIRWPSNIFRLGKEWSTNVDRLQLFKSEWKAASDTWVTPSSGWGHVSTTFDKCWCVWQTQAILKLLRRSSILEKLQSHAHGRTACPALDTPPLISAAETCNIHFITPTVFARFITQGTVMWAGMLLGLGSESLSISSVFQLLPCIPEGKEAYSKNTCQVLQKPGLKGLREMCLQLWLLPVGG